MKKAIYTILVLILALSMTGCRALGSDSDADPGDSTTDGVIGDGITGSDGVVGGNGDASGSGSGVTGRIGGYTHF